MSVVTNAVRTRGSQQNLFGVFYRHGNRIVSSSFSTNWNGYSNRSIEGHCGFQSTAHRFFRSSAVFLKKKSYYDVLGVGKSATKEEIKSKYREMAKKCHPDLNRNDKSAEEKFKEITAAYEVLENDAKRQTYDNYGIDGVEVRSSCQLLHQLILLSLLPHFPKISDDSS
jgi:DnaJ domain